jgi:predicted anti-sigma-YlaC factor YlaD
MIRLTCKKAHRLLAESMDRRLAAADNVRVHLHLGVCPWCRNFARQMQTLRKAVKTLGTR